ncbi:hypothetical protein FRC07_002314, partial [Ceratobasidium sp. 392]
CGADRRIRLHLSPAPDSFIAVPPDPVEQGSIFYIGLLPLFLDETGRLYSVRDNAEQLEPKQVFDSDDAAWASLIVNGLETWLNSSNLPGPVTPTAIHEASILHPGLDQTANDAPVVPLLGPLSHYSLSSSEPILAPNRPRSGPRTPFSPPPDSLPTLSPASSDSSGSESSFATDAFYDYPALFSNLSLRYGLPTPTAAPNTLAPEIPSLSKHALWTKADIDRYIDWLIQQRKLRASGRSPVELRCPRCNHQGRRPCEFKEHLYAHTGLAVSVSKPRVHAYIQPEIESQTAPQRLPAWSYLGQEVVVETPSIEIFVIVNCSECSLDL